MRLLSYEGSVAIRDPIPVGVRNAGDALQVLLEDVQYEEQLLRDYALCGGGVGNDVERKRRHGIEARKFRRDSRSTTAPT